jgi:type IV pilus assembly protein PilV
VRARTQRGVTMLEVLVTLLIITIWLLATAGVQSTSLKLTKASQFRTNAVMLVSDLSERMESNRASAAAGSYACADTAACLDTSASSCVGTSCSAANLKAFDLAEWGSRVKAAMPSGVTATITFNGGTPPSYTITLGWTDRGNAGTTGTTETMTYTTTKTLNSS